MQYDDSWLAVWFNVQALVTTEMLFIGYFESLELKLIFVNFVNKTELKKDLTTGFSFIYVRHGTLR